MYRSAAAIWGCRLRETPSNCNNWTNADVFFKFLHFQRARFAYRRWQLQTQPYYKPIQKNMSPDVKNLRHFQHIFGTQLCPGQCFPLGYRLGFVQSTFFVSFCSADFVKNLKPITESIPIFELSTLHDRTECDLVLPQGNIIFPVVRDRDFVGYRPVCRTLTTHVRRNGQARRWRTPDDYKNLTKNIFLTKCFRTLCSQV